MEASNVKAMREAVEYASRVLAKWRQDAPFSAWNEYGEAIDRCRAALAKPARNCDRFRDWEETLSAFREETGNRKPLELWLKSEIQEFAIWLFATESEQKGGAK